MKSSQRGRLIAEPGGTRLWVGLIILGFALRFALSAMSFGTNDAGTWRNFADEILRNGLLETYRQSTEFNHPPLAGYWAAAALLLAGQSGSVAADALFTNVFKLPAILADGLGVWLLWRIWHARASAGRAAFVAAMFAISFDAILVSAYHCNTDSIYVALCLLAVYLIEDQRRDFWGGFALGAAINVKIIPIVFVPVLLLSYRQEWRRSASSMGGLALWVLPFLLPMFWLGGRFIHNVFGYTSLLDRWGVNFFVLVGRTEQQGFGRSRIDHGATWYYFHAKYLILAVILAWAICGRALGRWTRYDLALVTFALFMVLTPGFGVQYTVIPGLLLIATRPLLGALYGLLAGLLAASAYWHFWTGTWPAMSQWTSSLPMSGAVFGLLAWLLLIVVIPLVWRHPFAPQRPVAT